MRGMLLRVLVLIALVLGLYPLAFSQYPVIEREHSILGDADAANYVYLLRNFAIDQQIGDEWNRENRSVADIAQKHKVHHVLYAVAGTGIYRAARPVFAALGLSPDGAVYAVNAVIIAINLLLLWALLRGANPNGNPLTPFLLFYAAALSTIIFGSVPESWPFSATLVLLYLLLLRQKFFNTALFGAIIGLFMLNNVFLGALAGLLFLRILRDTPGFVGVIKRTAIAGVCMVATWLAGLTALSVFDESYRPDHFIRYTMWFKQFVRVDLPKTDPYVWQSASTNLFVNSVVSNQPDPRVPQEALQTTLTSSIIGLIATAAWVAIAGLAAMLFLRALWINTRARKFSGLLQTEGLVPAVWCITMLAVTVVLFYPSGFLYSTVVVPALALFLCATLNFRQRWQGLAFFALLLLMMVNNVMQVLTFRTALSAM